MPWCPPANIAARLHRNPHSRKIPRRDGIHINFSISTAKRCPKCVGPGAPTQRCLAFVAYVFDFRIMGESFAELLIPLEECVAFERLLIHVKLKIDNALGIKT